jgi:hypothetical protein
MFKYLVVLALCLCALTVFSQPSQAQMNFGQCYTCSSTAFCRTTSTFGGCGCQQFYKNGYRYCAYCGGCIFFVCAQPCGGAAVPAAMQAIPLAPLAAWVTDTGVVAAIKLSSPTMSGLLESLQERYKTQGSCSSLRGRIAKEGTPGEGADWAAVVAANGVEIGVSYDSGREERLSTSSTAWTFRRDGAVLNGSRF